MNQPFKLKHAQDLQTIKRFIGGEVHKLAYAQCVFNGEPDETDLGNVEVTFTDGKTLMLVLASDGDSVHAQAKPLEIPEAFDIEENVHAAWQRVELTETPDYAFVKGSSLVAVEALIDRWKNNRDESLVGWVLRFNSDRFITYWNAGDQGWLLIDAFSPPYEKIERRSESVGPAEHAA